MIAAIPDWEQFASEHPDSGDFPLKCLKQGDILEVSTGNTKYKFSVQEEHALLTSSQPNRPRGVAWISGCGFAFSHAFKPGYLFCGGSLEFIFLRDGKRTRFRTTTIRSIDYLPSRP